MCLWECMRERLCLRVRVHVYCLKDICTHKRDVFPHNRDVFTHKRDIFSCKRDVFTRKRDIFTHIINLRVFSVCV